MGLYSQTSERQPALNFGAVFSRGFSAVRSGGLGLLTIGLLFVFLPQAVGIWLAGKVPGSSYLIPALLTATLGMIGRVALISAGLAAMRGRQISLGESILKGLQLLLPALGLTILSGIAIGLGTLLLVIPGIFLAVSLCVAMSIRIDRQTSVTDALAHSFEMTRGNRWLILAICLIIWIVPYLMMMLVGAMLGAFGGARIPLLATLLPALETMLQMIITSLTNGSIYIGLTTGSQAAVTADIFD